MPEGPDAAGGVDDPEAASGSSLSPLEKLVKMGGDIVLGKRDYTVAFDHGKRYPVMMRCDRSAFALKNAIEECWKRYEKQQEAKR